MAWGQLGRILRLISDDVMGIGRKDILSYSIWFPSMHLSKMTKGKIRVFNPKQRSNLMEPSV